VRSGGYKIRYKVRALAPLACVLLLVTASAAGAGGNPHPGGTVILTGTVCDWPLLLKSHVAQPQGVEVSVDAWVGGRRLLGALKGSTVYMFGNSSLVQAPTTKRGPFVVRAVRTLSRCAPLRVVFTWGGR